MLPFGEFFQGKSDYFVVEGIHVFVEPVPLGLFERHIIGVDDSDHTNMTKYRVVFKYPKSERKADKKDFHQEIRYVLAQSPREARQRIEEFVRKRRMKSYGGVKSDIPVDYLTNLNRQEMDIKVKPVTSWQDFVDLCAYIAKKKPQNPVRYFDQHDLAIFIKKYRKSADFAEQLQKLPKEVQLVMKRVYFHVIQGDLSHDNSTELQKGGKYAKDMQTREILNRKAKGLGRWYPKPQLKDINEEPPSMGSAAEVIQMAKMYGIPYKDLKGVKDQLAYEYDPNFEEKLRAYKEIRERLYRANAKYIRRTNPLYKGTGRISMSRFEGGDELGWDKYGADEWASELSREYPWLDSQEKIYQFYNQGMPRMAPPLDLWSRALEYILHHKRQEKENPTPQQPEEPIPF